MPEVKGALVAGAAPRAGKTVVAAGIAGVLLDLGFKVQAIRPLMLTSPTEPCPDQAFMDLIEAGRVMQRVENIVVPHPADVTTLLWNRLVDNVRKSVYPVVLEAPGTVAQPWKMDDSAFLDVVDVSHLLNLPIILAVRKSPEIIADIAPALAYLYEGEADVLGWVAVETAPQQPSHWEADMLLISREYQTPCLGEIPWSPSVSVERLQQGNLLKLTEAGLDLFPVQQALDLMLDVR